MESRTKKQTRKMIQETFVSLISEKKVDKIKVSDIVKIARINRSTFYEYYADTHSLLMDIEDEFLREFHQQLGIVYPKMTMEYSDEILAKALDLLNMYGDTFFALLGSNGDPSFSIRFVESIKTFILSAFGLNEFTSQIDTLITFEMSGIIGVYTKWFADGKQQPLKDIVKTLQEILYASSHKYIL